MSPRAWSEKDERQYRHIKKSEREPVYYSDKNYQRNSVSNTFICYLFSQPHHKNGT